ncbi:MAG: copper chaperone PCu(A)C [Paracoccaceae bacterium]
MKLKNVLLSVATAVLLGTTAFAGDAKIMVDEPYLRSTNPKVAAAFMGLMNHAGQDDRLISATSDIAKRVELHTHIADGHGVMKMTEIKGGIAVPAEGLAHLKRGGDHIMFMGVTKPLNNGDVIEVTLTFEKAGDVKLEIPVDNDRKPQADAHGEHKTH